MSAAAGPATAANAAAGSARFRRNGALVAAALVGFIGTVPLATASWLLTPLLLIPLGVAAWAWRTGTDADTTGIVVRAVAGRRRVPWQQIATLQGDGRGGAVAVLETGGLLRLPAVRTADLPRLTAASGRTPAPAR